MPRFHWFILLLMAFAVHAHEASSLFDRLGGQAGVERIADQLIERSRHAEDTKRSFVKVDIVKLKASLARQLCELSDGPCSYQGDDMRRVHKGLGITEREFYAMVQQLRELLNELGVDEASKNELLARLAPMKKDVIE